MMPARAVSYVLSAAITAVLLSAPRIADAKDVTHVRMTVAEAKRFAIAFPMPQYPLGARSAGMKGSGIFLVYVRNETGVVTRVKITPSTGYKALDESAVSALRRWRFRPGSGLAGLTVPITFD